MYKKTVQESYEVIMPILELEYSIKNGGFVFHNFETEINVMESVFGNRIVTPILMYALAKAKDVESNDCNCRKCLFDFDIKSDNYNTTLFCTIIVNNDGTMDAKFTWNLAEKVEYNV